MKWLLEPSEPNCSVQFFAYVAGSNPASAAMALSSSRRVRVWSRLIVRFTPPADSGMARSIA